MFEPSKAELQLVGNILENDWQGFFDGASEQSLKSGSDEGEGTGRVRVAYQAFVLPPLRVAFPMSRFAAPMGTNDGRHAWSAGFGFCQAADEMTLEYLVLLNGLGFRAGLLGLVGRMGLRWGRGWGYRRLGGRGTGALDRCFVGRLGACLDQLVGFGEVTRGGIGGNGAELPEVLASVAAFG